jgi:hypothetical protein
LFINAELHARRLFLSFKLQTRSRIRTTPNRKNSNGFGLFPDDAVGVMGPADGGVVRDGTLAVQIVQAIVHEHHSVLASGLDHVFQLVKLVFTDQIPHGPIRHDQFIRQNAAGAIRRRQQILGNDSL